VIVVTTPSGTVGSEFVQLLIKQVPSLPFRLVTRTPEKLISKYGADVATASFDFADHTTWDAAFERISILFLVVPKPDPKEIRANIFPLIDAAVRAGCQHILFLSVPGADKQKFLPHYLIERYVEACGVAYTILRASYFMQNLCGKSSTHGVDIATRNEIFIPAGRGELSFIDTRDIAAVLLKICENPEVHQKKAYLLTGRRSLNFFEVAKIFSQVMERPVHYAHPSLLRFWQRMARRGVPGSLIFFMAIEYTATSLGHGKFLSDDLLHLLGRLPTPMTQFVEDNKERWLTQSWV